jgi:ABC-type multidrug transport system ATPase subunit
MSITLQTRHLRKYFGSVHAVEDVSLDVYAGEVFGFLGPNGAGKTTAIGMMLGLIYPTAGEIEVLGQPVTPSRTESLKRVGALVGAQPSLIPYLSARQNIEIVADLHPGVTKARVDEVLDLVKLTAVASRKAQTFSTGMKQRLGLAMALVHHPELLILDEPTNGMDPAGMREVRNLLRGLAEEGATIFLSSHLLHEIEQVADRVAVLNRGEIVAQGRVDELLKGGAVVKVRVPDTRKAAEHLRGLPGVQAVEPNGAYLTVTGRESEAVVAHLAQSGIIPSEVTSPQNDLETLFMQLTQEA